MDTAMKMESSMSNNIGSIIYTASQKPAAEFLFVSLLNADEFLMIVFMTTPPTG